MKRAGGFTLIEVMVALAVVGSLLVTLLYTLNYHLGIAERHETSTKALMLAKEKLAAVRKAPAPAEGKFPEPYSDYAFKAEVMESPYPGYTGVSVTVARGKERLTLREIVATK